MKALQGLVSGLLVASLTFAPALAHAQYVPENTPETCADGIDNDGNGYVDCYDPSCRTLPQCQPQQPQYAPPPPQYAPPPPQYYQQQPYQPVYVPPPPPRQPSNGLGDIIVGSIFLPMGLILLGTSTILWDACNVRTSTNIACFDRGEAWGALTMDIFGAGFLIIGAILLPIGIVKAVKYNKWKHSQGRPMGLIDLGHGVGLSFSKDLSIHF
jgi:hypothetical protein